MVSRVSSSPAGASVADIWAYATRKLIDYHISSGATVGLLAENTSFTPAAGYRFTLSIYPEIHITLEGYDGSVWQTIGTYLGFPVRSYQKVTSGTGAQRGKVALGYGAQYYGYFWENVGASPVQPFKPESGELVLEETPDWIITVSEKWLLEHKAEIEVDVEDKMGYDQHRDVLTKMGFNMPKKEVK